MHVSYQTLAGYVSYHFGIEAETLRPDITFEELEMDSLALMELVVVIESETRIQIPDDAGDIGPHTTLAEAAEAVSRIGECAAR
ncbi:acyl carrier protein [Streptomyces sp. NPDC060010]|uniref:acyl carrier protein n=1 Tax=Streptomyces sp. NPDC060010 TaxID=3347036 RepID=UPI0036986590